MCLQSLQPGGSQGYVPVDPVPAVLARLIGRAPDKLLPHMHFEGDFCLNCDWRRIDLEASSRARCLLVCPPKLILPSLEGEPVPSCNVA